MADEWDRYVADQKYAKSLRIKAEAGHVKGLMILAAMTASLSLATIWFAIWLVRSAACWAWWQAC